MKAENFCFWLQGFFELGNGQCDGITTEQAEQIKTHLALVFKHDPAMEHAPPVKRSILDREQQVQRQQFAPHFSDVMFC